MASITDPILFRLSEHAPNTVTVEGNGRLYQAPAGWFKIIKSNHPKSGLQFILPLKHPEYSDEIQSTLMNLEEGDTLWMECIATNDQNTAWRVFGIAEDEAPEL